MAEDERAIVRGKLQRWLTEEEIFEGVHSVDNPESYFRFDMKHKLGMALCVQQLVGNRDRILIESGRGLTKEQLHLLEGMAESKLREFVWDLRFSLLSYHVAFKMDTKLDPNGLIPHQIIVAQSVWYDGLTKNLFMKAIQTVAEAVMFSEWKLRSLPGASDQKQDSNSYIA